MKGCKVKNCTNPHKGKGYCDKHIQQYRKHGESGVDKEVNLASKSICKNPSCKREFGALHRRHFFCTDECKYTFHNGTENHRELMNNFNRSDKGKARSKKYCATKKGKKYLKEKGKRHRENHPDRYFARTIAARNIPASTCSISGCEEKGERHHEDYNKPLDVIYLCRKHHMDFHHN